MVGLGEGACAGAGKTVRSSDRTEVGHIVSQGIAAPHCRLAVSKDIPRESESRSEISLIRVIERTNSIAQR